MAVGCNNRSTKSAGSFCSAAHSAVNSGHGFARAENRLHFYARAEAFLANHLGGRAESVGEIKGHSGVVR